MAPLLWIVLVSTSVILAHAEPAVNLSLNGEWRFTNANRSISGVGLIPGTIYTALTENKILKDPYYRYNDINYRWVSYDNWTYSRTFNVSRDLLQHDSVELWADGVDTVSRVTINNQTVGDMDNMFRRYVFDIKPMLKEGVNIISFAFTSAVLYAKAQSEVSPYSIPPDCPSPVQHGECHFNFIRKSATSFSWDWGPAFLSQGIWKNITVKAYNTATIEYITAETVRGTGRTDWILRGDVFFRTVNKPVTGKLFLKIFEVKLSVMKVVTISPNMTNVSYEMPVYQDTTIYPWWPNGHGGPRMYDLEVTFSSDGESCSKRISVGFRTIELVQEPVPGSTGLSFYFKINDKPVFMKGTNWIPADSFQERITPQYLHKVLSSAQKANMNMIRINGVGVYESEEFYELTDRLGILVWQDLMYVSALYPATGSFVDNVRTEVTQQIRRLKHHPSIAIWSGNNEVETGLRQDWFGIKDHFEMYYKDYIKLYVDTIRAVVMEEDQSRPFVSSCPSNGIETEREGWVAKNPEDLHYGDIHFYNYYMDSWNWTNYPIPRFATEFGFVAWSSFETMKQVTVMEDWAWNGTFATYRQHHPQGNEQMMTSVSHHMTVPATRNEATFFMYFTYMTQIDQAVAIKTEAELHRRMQSNLRGEDGMTMGSLYWQLNDIWQAPTWASIEYGGKWKMLHYYATHFFNTTLVSSVMDGDVLSVYYIDERMTPGGSETNQERHASEREVWRSGASEQSVISMDQNLIMSDVQGASYTLKIDAFDWSSMSPKKTWIRQFDQSSNVSTEVFSAPVTDLLTEASCDWATCFFYLTVFYDQAMTVEGPSNWQILNYYKDVTGLKKASLQVTNVNQTGKSEFSITLTTDAIAVFVWLEASGLDGYFSDNGFIMIRPQIQLQYLAWEETYTVEEVEGSLKAWSLMDLYD